MTRTAAILRPADRPTNDRGNGARTTPLVTRECGSTSVINGITELDPGASIKLHKHNCEESVMVLEGDAVAEIDGTRHEMRAGDTTWIPVGLPHRFINASASRKMRIFWTYASVDANRTIVETGETHTIDAEHERNVSR